MEPAVKKPAERLHYLFETIYGRTRPKFSEEDIAEAARKGTAESPGVVLEASALRSFRSGDESALSPEQLEGVAVAFGLPRAYFADQELAIKVDKELELLAVMRDAGIRISD